MGVEVRVLGHVLLEKVSRHALWMACRLGVKPT